VYGCSVVILVRPCIQSCIICFLSLDYIYPIMHYLLVTTGFPTVFLHMQKHIYHWIICLLQLHYIFCIVALYLFLYYFYDKFI
jgi:hypothetical protein